MEKNSIIYALADPRTGEIRYIGKTCRKLKEFQVLEIIDQLNEGGSQQLIADKFGVSKNCVHHIAKGNTWGHLTHLLLPMHERKTERKKFQGEDHHCSKLSNAQVEEIRELLKAEKNMAKIARMYGVTRQRIYQIKQGRTRVDS